MGATAVVVDRAYFRDLLGTTPNDKEIYLVRKPNAPLRTLAFGSGGQLPEHLQGGYSSVSAAKLAVTDYIASLVLAAAKKSQGRSTTKK